MTEKISRSIFKAYDIRGIVDKTLTEEACEQIGQALGTLAHEKKVEKICEKSVDKWMGEWYYK